MRQRLAHFISVALILPKISARSSADLSGSHAEGALSSSDAGGSMGVRRMIAPRIQNGGNTKGEDGQNPIL